MDPVGREELQRRVEGWSVERAKEKSPEGRDLLETLLAADIPFERAVSLVADATGRAARGALTEYAWLIREARASQLPEGSEERRRVLMIADMLDPAAEDTWEYPPRS